MLSLLTCICLAYISAVLSQDPTTICLPTAYYTNYTNLLTGDYGYIVTDFGKELLVEISKTTNLRLVLDFKNLKSYEIKANVCREARLPPSRIQTRCLPPYAKIIPTLSGYVGNAQVSYGAVYVQTWEVATEFDIVYRESFTVQSGQPYWLTMSQELGYHGTNNIYVYTNPKAGAADLWAFQIPPTCESEDLGGPIVIG
ncbi:Ovipostatin 6 [Biomphalaria glabrata]|nr:Ovipostatin 6 [Biomphalaria glabrata]